MATRFYLPSIGTAAVEPVDNATWTRTTDSRLLPCVLAKSGTSHVTYSIALADFTNQLISTFVSPPLDGYQIISGSVKGQIQTYTASASTANFRGEIYVVSGDGLTVRGTLFSEGAIGDGVSLNNSLRNKIWSNSDTLSAVGAEDGDRIVFKIGITHFGFSNDVFFRLGDTETLDLPENNTETSTAFSPWLELSQTLSFSPEASPPILDGYVSVLNDRWNLYVEQRRIYRNTAIQPSVADTVNALYTEIEDVFDGYQYMKFGTPITADTPSVYNIGLLGTGDVDPWFIDQTSTEYLASGSVQTVGWTRVQGSNTGIIRMKYTESTPLVESDIGKIIVMTTDGDNGIILDYNSDKLEMFIRPADSSIGNSFDNSPTSNGAFTITSGTGTGNQNGLPTTGEYLYTNISSVGLTSLQANTTLNVYQDGYKVVPYKGSSNWWDYGDIDILVPVVKESQAIDSGLLLVTARRANSLYSHFISNALGGGKNPIPLAANIDFNDIDGTRQMVLTTGATAAAQVGEIIQDDSNSSIQGVITSVSGTNPNVTIQYYLIGDPQTDFSSLTGSFTGQTSGFTATAVDPTDVSAATYTGVTINFGATTADVDEDSTNELYSITIDCDGYSLLEVYQRTKYLTRTGETSTIYTDGIEGQQYIGSDYRITYTTLTNGPLPEGTTVTQLNTGASGTVVAHHTSDNIIILRNSKGTFNDTDQISDDNSSANVTGVVCETISTNPASPFGVYAGGSFFPAPGVLLTNVDAQEVNNYQLIDDTGVVRAAPTQVSFTLTGLVSNSEVRIYNTSDGSEIAGSDSTGTSFSYNYVYSTNINIYVVIFHLSYKEIRLTGLTLSNVNQSIPIQQNIDRVYSNP